MARIGELIGPNQEVIHPKTSASVVYLEDGRSVEQVLSNDIDYGNTVFQDNTYHFGNDVEDDFAKTMIIKGQTYQNILPEPSLRNSMNNEKTTQKFNEGYDNVNVVDGVGKSAILKGCTLVNHIGRLKTILTSEVTEVSRNRYRIGCTSNYQKVTIQYDGSFKVGSKIMYKIYDVKSTFTNGRVYQTGSGASLNYDVGEAHNTTSIYTITESEANYGVIEYQGNPHDGYFEFSLVILEYQDGMENWDIPYFEGMKSVQSPSLVSVGKNLFDKSKAKFNTCILTDGNAVIDNRYVSSDFIEVAPSTRYTSHTLGVVFFYDSNKTLLSDLNTSTLPQSFTTPVNCKYIRVRNWSLLSSLEEQQRLVDTSQIEPGSQATPYEPHKTITLTTPSDLILRGIGDVYDTLDLVSGEKVERIGVGVFDGSDDEVWHVEKVVGDYTTFVNYEPLPNIKGRSYTLCDKLLAQDISEGEYHSVQTFGNYINILTSKASDVSSFRNWLKQNELTIYYPLETPIVKTVDLSSSGNWEKVVLDGSERWIFHDSNGEYVEFRFANTINNVHASRLGFSNKFPVSAGGRYERIAIANGATYITVKNIKAQSVEQLQSWLSQNPITVWYQTTTSQPNSIKEMLSFSNGHIQLSSKEGSLIPSLDYEIPTSNSYHMDLMKTDTNYTVKSTNPSGMCDIGDVKGITIPSNYLWNVPSARKGDMLLVVHGSWTNPMILEGDVTDKAIPYFKGVKSAFEGEDKIEVLSVGKNLWSDSYFKPHSTVTISGRECIAFSSVSCQNMPLDNPFFVNKDKYYRISGEFVKTKSDGKNQYFGITIQINGAIYGYPNAVLYVLGNGTQPLNQFYRDGVTLKFPESGWVTSLSVVNYGSVNLRDINVVAGTLLMEELNSTSNNGDVYVKHKSNITKIPLSSPLRSLPNGVCDEVILDRENNKVKVIQRVGYEVFDGSENWQRDSFNFANRNFLRFITFLTNVKTNGKGLCDKLPVLEGDAFGMNYIRPSIDRTWIYKADLTVTTDSLVRELSTDPLTLYYELATPIITEIDLDGYPYIYKDGHIFLNSEIAPTVGLEYSINQGHRIEGQVETLQRHEQQLARFERYFADLVYSDYNFALLKFNETLRQEEEDA